MAKALRTTILLAGIATAGVVAQKAAHVVDRHIEQDQNRWRAVTIGRSQEEIAPGGSLPRPLAALADRIEVQFRHAPGGRGTEVAARLVRGSSSRGARGSESLAELRSALRETKELAEVGEVMIGHPRPHGKRVATAMGTLLDAAEDRAEGEGVL
jgi:hypothetical protein